MHHLRSEHHHIITSGRHIHYKRELNNEPYSHVDKVKDDQSV